METYYFNVVCFFILFLLVIAWAYPYLGERIQVTAEKEEALPSPVALSEEEWKIYKAQTKELVEAYVDILLTKHNLLSPHITKTQSKSLLDLYNDVYLDIPEEKGTVHNLLTFSQSRVGPASNTRSSIQDHIDSDSDGFITNEEASISSGVEFIYH